jgi:dTDP-4-amino-4,6-dideoxygalactose transaminase
LDTPALAIFGAAPAFAEQLHVGRPNIGDRARFLARLNDILDRRWLTNHGEYVMELERRIAVLAGVRNCVLVANGTIGLELPHPGARPARRGHRPRVHVRRHRARAAVAGNHSGIRRYRSRDALSGSAQREAAITPRTSGIVGVHLWGRPCAVEELAGVASRHGLKLLFDAAHAFGCSRGERMIGSFGEAEVFSFTPPRSSTRSRGARSLPTTTISRRSCG